MFLFTRSIVHSTDHKFSIHIFLFTSIWYCFCIKEQKFQIILGIFTFFLNILLHTGSSSESYTLSLLLHRRLQNYNEFITMSYYDMTNFILDSLSLITTFCIGYSLYYANQWMSVWFFVIFLYGIFLRKIGLFSW